VLTTAPSMVPASGIDGRRLSLAGRPHMSHDAQAGGAPAWPRTPAWTRL
jgi:hypothetical protein